MAEVKPLASLSPSLLARKGAARPAMRPQGYINFSEATQHHAEDLGWNDMGRDDHSPAVVALPGHDFPEAQQQPAAPQVIQQQHDLAEKLSKPSAAHTQHGLSRAAPGARGKAAFTLRLDPERHLKLRLLSAFSHRSAQQIVTEALDNALELQAATLSSVNAQSPKG